MSQLLYFTKQLQRHAGAILYFNLLSMLLISLLEGAGILLLIPMLSMSGVLGAGHLGEPFATLLKFTDHSPVSIGLPMVLGIFLFVVSSQSLLQRSTSLRDVRINTKFINHVRIELYRALMRVKWEFMIKQRKSDLINSLTSELGRVTGGVQMFLQMLAATSYTIIQVMLAFWLSPVLTLLVLLCGIALILFSRKFIKQSQTLGVQTTALAKNYLAGITDHIQGIKDIKSNMLEQAQLDWLQTWSAKIEHERVENMRIRSQSQLYYKIASAVFISLFIYFSVHLFHAQIGELILIILIFSRLWPRFLSIQSNMQQIASAVPAFKDLIDLQQLCEQSAEHHSSADVEGLRLHQGLSCQHVDFRYNPQSSVYALKNISLFIPANRMTAIIGRSGAGKSTLVDVLMGLLQPEQGDIFIDGVRLTEANVMALRKSISYVPQDPFLFNGSIRDNLMMVKPDATERQMSEALAFSSAAEFVGRLPQGLDTLIGDRGIRLSGGERQRLVLARAILKQPSILVLDEATSALDTENEAKIQEAIAKIRGSMTIIVIAHRLSTIRNADQVIVLDYGRMIQSGTYVLGEKDDGGFRENSTNIMDTMSR